MTTNREAANDPGAEPIARLNAALEERYRIERELGAGGMATVYLAEDLKHKRKVALMVSQARAGRRARWRPERSARLRLGPLDARIREPRKDATR